MPDDDTVVVAPLQLVSGVCVALVASWLVLLLVLVVARPKGMGPAEAAQLVPDLLRLVRSLAGDDSLPPGVRRRLGLLLAYLAMPFDLVPDVIPLLGQADDVIVVGLVLRSVVRAAGPAALERHWSGTPAGLSLVRRVAGLRDQT
ncbi:MAG: DUF1232 domain-containing protein [Actinomycetota bacterium]|nr:DUF1232 domain-containing protein [Actinomycetota bacterium]